MTPAHGLTLVTPAAAEPVALADLREHLRVDSGQDESLLAAYLAAARAYLERITGRALMPQTWRMTLDAFPTDAFELAIAPVQSITSISYLDTAGATQTVPGGSYVLDATRAPARVALAPGASWPATRSQPAAVTVQFVAGYTDAAVVPAPLRHALMLLVGHWYEHREAVAGGAAPSSVPLSFEALVAAYRVHWL